MDTGDASHLGAGFNYNFQEVVKNWILPAERNPVCKSQICWPYVDPVDARCFYDLVDIFDRLSGFYLDETKDLRVHVVRISAEEHLRADRAKTSSS